MLAKSIFARVRALVGDPDQNWATDPYLTPLVEQALEDFSAEFTNMDVGFDEQNVRLDNVPAGTHDLSAYQAAGAPLERMVTPLWMEWKLAGEPDENYRVARPKDEVRSVANLSYINGWDWVGGVIEINPATVAVDLRVRAQLLPPEIGSADDAVTGPLGMLFAVAYLTAELVGYRRGNPQFIEGYGKKYNRAVENIEMKFVKATQGRVRRAGRSIGRGAHFGSGYGQWPRFR